MVNVLLAELLLPTVSVHVEPPTETVPVPESVFAVGVNVAVYVVPLPVKPLTEPPETLTSDEMKFAEDSESVNVMISVSPEFRDPEPARVTETVGTKVS
jgi:hypothetical protein